MLSAVSFHNSIFKIQVVAIMGLSGACHCDELKNLMIDDIEDMQSHKNQNRKVSYIHGSFCMERINERFEFSRDLSKVLVSKSFISHRRLFINYQKGECMVQQVGIKKVAKIPQMIAKFLKISDASLLMARHIYYLLNS
jgi:hypothetical protein